MEAKKHEALSYSSITGCCLPSTIAHYLLDPKHRYEQIGTCWDLEVNINLKTQPPAEKVNVTLVGNWLWERPHSAHCPFFPQIWHHKMMKVALIMSKV
jgi:hypothetical protein